MILALMDGMHTSVIDSRCSTTSGAKSVPEKCGSISYLIQTFQIQSDMLYVFQGFIWLMDVCIVRQAYEVIVNLLIFSSSSILTILLFFFGNTNG